MDLGTSLCITAAALAVLTYALWTLSARRTHAQALVRVDGHLEARRRLLALRLREEMRR